MGKEEEKHFVSQSPQGSGAEGWLMEMLVASGMCHHLGLSGTHSHGEQGEQGAWGGSGPGGGGQSLHWVLGAQLQGVPCVWGAVSPWAEGLLRVSFLIPVALFPHI